MGDPKKKHKQYEKPKKVWDSERIARDRKTLEEYGLKNMREIWRSQTILRNKRRMARRLLAAGKKDREQRKSELLSGLQEIGILNENATLDDVLGLKERDLLERRLQTLVFRKGLANTAQQARQLIVHGHIGVNGRKVSAPGYLVAKKLENDVSYYGKPIDLRTPLPEKKDKRKQFEEAKPEAEIAKVEE
ncbi:MAG: 30S ribosomal protein S4 [Candidatus Diapherotrites archaeon]